MPPKPEPGMVLSYSYLWNREHIKGETEGRKDRPSVVVLVINQTPGDLAYPAVNNFPRKIAGLPR
jgi:hypothetical protein